MKLDQYCQTLNSKLAESSDPEVTLKLAALALQQAFKVKDDEVAFLWLDEESEMIHFLWPRQLGSAGNIPLGSRSSLAAETIREKRPQLHNRFSAKHHAVIFEQVKLDRSKEAKDKTLLPIQKIMSAPMLRDGTPVGAVQVCRKGSDEKSVGADFTKLELEALTAISGVIAQHL